MKTLGILLVGALAVAGGIAAATYITKKKLEKDNEDNYYDDWDSDDIDDDFDFDFDEDMDVEGEPSLKKSEDEGAAIPETPFGGNAFSEGDNDNSDEEL